MDIIDEPIIQVNAAAIKYAGFWPRLAALIIDGIILWSFSLLMSFVDIPFLNSMVTTILFLLVSVLYKPFLEIMYGATLGKMALRMRVVNEQFGKAGVSEILLRNIFNLTIAFLRALVMCVMLIKPDFDMSFFPDEGWLGSSLDAYRIVLLLNFLLMLVDTIVLLSDYRFRSLHDKIARTFVIYRA